MKSSQSNQDENSKYFSIPLKYSSLSFIGMSVILIGLSAGLDEKYGKIFSAPFFGIFGVVIRHELQLKFNGLNGYPAGTFIANLSGSAFYSIFYSIKR